MDHGEYTEIKLCTYQHLIYDRVGVANKWWKNRFFSLTDAGKLGFHIGKKKPWKWSCILHYTQVFYRQIICKNYNAFRRSYRGYLEDLDVRKKFLNTT